jgi:hypothetical protein
VMLDGKPAQGVIIAAGPGQSNQMAMIEAMFKPIAVILCRANRTLWRKCFVTLKPRWRPMGVSH